MGEMDFALTMRADSYAQLQRLLLPGDGREAVAFALCATARSDQRTRLLVRKIIELPVSDYRYQSDNQVCWKTQSLIPLLEQIEQENLCLLKCHSHPGGIPEFSAVDDESDRKLIPACYQWNPIGPHASLVVSETGMTARIVTEQEEFRYLSAIQIVGDRLVWLRPSAVNFRMPEHRRFVQAFGEGTFATLRNLRIAVIGASGTGSLVIEALARSGVGEFVLVDPESIEMVNLNRVLHSKRDDAIRCEHKTSVAKRSIEEMGLGSRVTEIVGHIQEQHVIRAISSCDLIMGCVDNREARQLLCRIAAFYLLPYIDIGVAIHAAVDGRIENVTAGIHYIQPGQSFIARGVFDQEALRAEALHRTDPAHYQEQRRSGYVVGIDVERPAVMPLNMIAAGFGVMELLARVHGFRGDQQAADETLVGVDIGVIRQRTDPGYCPSLAQHLGRGDTIPPVNMPALSTDETSA